MSFTVGCEGLENTAEDAEQTCTHDAETGIYNCYVIPTGHCETAPLLLGLSGLVHGHYQRADWLWSCEEEVHRGIASIYAVAIPANQTLTATVKLVTCADCEEEGPILNERISLLKSCNDDWKEFDAEHCATSGSSTITYTNTTEQELFYISIEAGEPGDYSFPNYDEIFSLEWSVE